MSNADSWSHRELQDHEYPEPDETDDGSLETVPCPKCGAEVCEEAVQCPRCGEFIETGSQLWSNRSWWWVLLGGIGIAAVLASCLLI